MRRFRDALYFMIMINYHFMEKNCIILDSHRVLVEPSDANYPIDNNYSYESINYKVTIVDKNNNIVYRTIFTKISASLDYVETLDIDSMNDYIFSSLYSLNGRMYVSNSYMKTRDLQNAHPSIAEEVGLLSTKDPAFKVQREVYRGLRDTLAIMQIDLKKMRKRMA